MLLEQQNEAATPTGSAAIAALVDAEGAKPKGSTSRLWRRLNGRRRWVVVAVLVGGLLGGVAGLVGWGKQTFEASAFVQLGLATEAGPTGLSEATAVVDGVRFDEVIQRELTELRRLGGEPGQADALEVKAAIDPEADTRLTLWARAQSPVTAENAVRSILAGYTAVTELADDAERAAYYQTQWNTLLRLRRDAAQARANLVAERPDAGEGEPPIDLDAAWSAANTALRSAQRDSEAARRWADELRAMDPPTTAEVAALDAEAAAWLGRQRALDEFLSATAWPPAPAAAQRLRERAELEGKLRERAADTRVLPVGEGSLVFRGVRVGEANARAEAAAQRLTEAEKQVAQLQPLMTQRRAKEAEAQRLAAAVAEAEAQLAALDPGPGLRLVSSGFVPDAAHPVAKIVSDSRPMWAGVGACGGGLLGGLIVAVFFLGDRRVRRVPGGALADSSLPLISEVPVLGAEPENRDGPDAGPLAGTPAEVSSIQSVRAVLEARMARGQGAFGVAGVGPGSGTTSIAAGLAVSMALSGSRVLLIDLAWLQKPAGGGTDAEAARDGLGIDGMIEELGYLEDEDAEVLALGGDADIGFGALLEGASLRRSVVHTRLPGLAILSAMGRAEVLRRRWAGRLSSRWLSKLLAVSRKGGYAVTILDTGSATGSVEGMLGCAAADGTIVVVSQHENQAEYDKAVSRLELIGATPIGTVLNRSGGRRRGETRGRRRSARGPGATTGSGIFAAAIEARAGGGEPSNTAGSGMIGAPLPTFDEASTASIAPGVDPIDEPPAAASPTPPRTPPPALAAAPAAADSAEAGLAPQASPESEAAPPPRVHVIDDVMDQIVDHAIRSAKRSRSGPPAASTQPTTDD